MAPEINFSPGQLNPAFDVSVNQMTTGGGDEQLLPSQRDRVYLYVFSPTVITAFSIGPFSLPNENTGFIMNGPDDATLVFLYRDIGSILGREWRVSDLFGGNVVTTVEVIFRPQYLGQTFEEASDVSRINRNRQGVPSGPDNGGGRGDVNLGTQSLP